MKDGNVPNPNNIHPIAGYDKEIYVKPKILPTLQTQNLRVM